ncbi:MAG: hypothetical protein E7608_02500 [Ruminococcaceae bacterium]|nr:hypothetical protein [Oscillospiraceae bacterium]
MYLAKLQHAANEGWNTLYNENILSHVLLPWGFSINLSFRKKSSGEALRSLLINRESPVRTDVRSIDGSYTCLHIRHGNVPIKVESASANGEQIIIVTPEGYYSADEQLIVETSFLWGRDGTLVKKNGMLGAICPDGRRIQLYSNTAPCAFYLPEQILPSMIFEMNSPVVISTFPCTAEKACGIVGELRAVLLKDAQKYAEHAEAYIAMQSCLGWNTVYDPIKDRVCTPVTRNWNKGKNINLFCWDTFFGALMMSLNDTKFSYLNIKAIIDEMTAEGMIPNSLGSNHSQPPVGSMVIEEIYKKNGDVELLRKVYPSLLRWNTWYCENRMTEEGYMCWGTGSYGKGREDLFGAKCESGMDNSPIFDDAVCDEKSGLCMIADVGLMGLFVKDCRTLIDLSRELGAYENAELLKNRMERVQNALDTLWNEEDGIFENRYLNTGEFCRRLSPFNFFSLFSASVSEEQKKSIVEDHLLNENEFWGEYVLPSISKKDPAFAEQHYWRGRIWAPLNALVYFALKDAKLYREAKLLAEKSEKLLLKSWNSERRIYENYGAADGLGNSARQSDAFYHWGALLGYIALDAEDLI